MSPALKRRQNKLLKAIAEIDAHGRLESTQITLQSVLGAIAEISAIHPGSVTIEEFSDIISMYKFDKTK